MKFISFLVLTAVALRAADSASVDSLARQIVSQNPELHYYETEIEAARLGARFAGTRPPPELSVSAGHKRVRSADGGIAGDGAVWSVSVSQVFEWPGRVALRKAIANRQVSLAELGLARFKAALTARARLLAYGLHGAEEQRAATHEVAARYRELREVFLQRDPAGLTPTLETRVIEAQELVLQRRATEASLAVQAALNELNQLRGEPIDTPVSIGGGTLILHAAPAGESLLNAARENNFAFVSAKLELEQQGFEVSLARGERLPAVTVSPFLSQESAGDRERVFGLGFTLPLPVGGRTATTVGIAEARRSQAATALLLAQRQMEREVFTAAAIFEAKCREVSNWSPDSADKFREAAALADRHYRLGAVPLTTYIELQNSYLDAVSALFATQREALEAGLRLVELTGLDFTPVEIAP
jgi:cobalt-zinc-cadmium efflux system outer membrane protein